MVIPRAIVTARFRLPGYQRHGYRKDGHVLSADQVLSDRVFVFSRLVRLIDADEGRNGEHSRKHGTIDRVE